VRKPYIGGQAVIGGVMMRSPKSFVVAVRRPDGSIAVREDAWQPYLPSLKFLRWPICRGALVLAESMHNGYSALKFSAEQSLEEAAGEELGQGANAMLVIATLAMAGLFIAAPHLLTLALIRLLHLSLTPRGFAFHLIDGFFRIAILVGYIGAIARTKDAQKLFQFHGAEHKAIWTYESGQPLTVENARRFTTLHPRCGTSFLFVVVCVSVLVHIALIPLIPQLVANSFLNNLLLIAIKLPLAFPIAGFAYELQKISAKDSCPRWLSAVTAPGMWLQNITTKPPTDEQLEVALISLARALAREEGRSAAEGVAVYQSAELALSA
jgi:uncharacterized protein YqhQ